MRIFIFLFLFVMNIGAADDWPVLKGPYLGQKPPGMTPEIFVPGLLNNDEMGAFCTIFSPGGTEFYFGYYKKTGDACDIYWMNQKNGRWSQPEKLRFNSNNYENDVCMSADGNMLVFRSWRALPSGKKPKDHSYLWFAKRTRHGWSEAKPILCEGIPVRTGYPSLSQNNTLYFVHRWNGRFGIYLSKFKDQQYGKPHFVYEVFNQDFVIGDLFVSPDESYFIISGREPVEKGEFGMLDLYVIFRDSNETWSKPFSLGTEINTCQGSENCPTVSPDGKYFFFNRYNPDKKRGNMYWVSAAVITNIKKKATGTQME